MDKYCRKLLSKIQQVSSHFINHETRIWYLKSRKEPLIVVEELICRISGALKVGHFFMRPLPRTYRDGSILVVCLDGPFPCDFLQNSKKQRTTSGVTTITMRHRDPRKKTTAKKGKLDDKLTWEEDVFYSEVVLDKTKDVCSMCGGDNAVGEYLDQRLRMIPEYDDLDVIDLEDVENSILDPEGIWASRYSLSKASRVFVHYYCALYSPLAGFHSDKWCNLRREVLRGRQLKCNNPQCQVSGATLKCAQKKCQYGVHLTCMLKEGYEPTRSPKHQTFLCKKCNDVRCKEEEDIETKALEDLSLGILHYLS